MITERAFAKVNLGLAVIARRGDGFHELDTMFALIGLHDDVSGSPAVHCSLEVMVEGAVPGADALTGAMGDNVALQAARAFQDATGSGGASLRLVKRIPVAAGLGGGSADAAAVLRIMARLYPEHQASVDLEALARQLGSDVPFMLSGQRAARGRGRGERLEPIGLPELHVVLVNPGVSVMVQDAYAELQNFSRRPKHAVLIEAIREGRDPRWINALQPGVTRQRPAIREAITALRAAGLHGVLMSGSGATCFGIAADGRSAAAEIAAALQAEYPQWWVRADCTGTGEPG